MLRLVARGCTIIFAFVSVSSVHAAYVGRDLYTLQLPAGLYSLQVNPLSDAARGGQAVAYAYTIGTNYIHPLLWTDKGDGTGKVVDLLPSSGFTDAWSMSTNGVLQGGWATALDKNTHAVVWNGSSNSFQDLATATSGFTNSIVRSISVNGIQRVGSAQFAGLTHAFLWNGGPDHFVDLQPTVGIDHSLATGTDGVHQAGEATLTSGDDHAVVWSGNADTFVDLNPDSIARASRAFEVYGNQSVGEFFTATSRNRPIVWLNNTPQSAVDLSLTGTNARGSALDTNGRSQVGYGTGSITGGGEHALLWNGTADSVVDLQALLPGKFVSSFASGIDAEGNIFGIAKDDFQMYHAVEWSVPEPCGLSFFAAGTILFLPRQRKKRSPAS